MEVLRPEGQASIDYYTSEDAVSIVYSVYDVLNDQVVEYNELEQTEPGRFNIVFSEETSRYDRQVRVDIDIIRPETYEQDHLNIFFVRPFMTQTSIYGYFTNTPNENMVLSISPEYLLQLERKARYLIQTITNDEFKFEYKTVGAYGLDTDLLHLGQRIESFDKITYDDYVIYDKTTDPEIDELGTTISIAPSKYGIKVVAEGTNISEWVDQNPIRNPAYFGKDSAYLVRGEYGWRELPEEIKTATCELILDFLCNDYIYRNKGLKSVQNDAFTVQFADGMLKGTGNLYVDALLAPYKSWNLKAI